MTNILIDIIEKSGKTRDEVADGIGITRQGLHRKLKYPKRWGVEDIEKFSKFFGRSPRNLFTLIMNDN